MIEGHDSDGWETAYVAITAEDEKIVSELTAGGLAPTIGNVLQKIADRMEKENGDIKTVLEADRVFDHGFDHLVGGFDASVDPQQALQSMDLRPAHRPDCGGPLRVNAVVRAMTSRTSLGCRAVRSWRLLRRRTSRTA